MRPTQSSNDNDNKRQRVDSPTSSKRARIDSPSHSTAILGTVQPHVASHYNNIVQKNIYERQLSDTIGLKNYNNWVKSILIKEYAINQYYTTLQQQFADSTHPQRGVVVLDLCCGKGGDIKKYIKNKLPVELYIGVDHAYQSLCDMVQRFSTGHSMLYPALIVHADCHRQLISTVLHSNVYYDIVSVQFALHYSFESKACADIFIRNIAERLVPNGRIILTIPDSNILIYKLRMCTEQNTVAVKNNVCTVTFDSSTYDNTTKLFDGSSPYGIRYNFILKDAIDDCPEYIVHMSTLLELFQQYNVHVQYDMNLHEFWAQYSSQPEYSDLARHMNVVSSHQRNAAPISPDEWDAIGLYKAVVLMKQPSKNDPVIHRRAKYPYNKQLGKLSVDDICVCLEAGKDKCRSTHDIVLNK